MIRVERIYRSNPTTNDIVERVERICGSNPTTNNIVEKLEDRLNDIVGNGGKIMQILEVGDNYTTNHYTVIYEDRRSRA